MPNIDRQGRRGRMLAGVGTILLGLLVGELWESWGSLVFILAGGFMLFEGLRGWCVVRACGIRTKL